jgi:hypothetical protein
MDQNLVLDEKRSQSPGADISGRAGYVPQGRAARLAPKGRAVRAARGIADRLPHQGSAS